MYTKALVWTVSDLTFCAGLWISSTFSTFDDYVAPPTGQRQSDTLSFVQVRDWSVYDENLKLDFRNCLNFYIVSFNMYYVMDNAFHWILYKLRAVAHALINDVYVT